MAFIFRLQLLVGFILLSCLATAAPTGEEPLRIKNARRLVAAAQTEAAYRNKFAIENAKHRAARGLSEHQLSRRDLNFGRTISLIPNATVAEAAALIAEYDAVPEQLSASELKKRQTASFWMEGVAHGRSAFGPADYKVFRNVKDYGAKGDGVTDDTAAINKAMGDQGRCGQDCGSSTIKPAVVYFPPGTYLVSTSIQQWYNTQMIGNPNSRPVIKAAPSFVGMGVITSNPYIPNGWGAQWYTNQNNFLRQIRNFVVDITAVPNIQPSGIHWQIAQATSLQNIEFRSSTAAGNNHQGIYMENGSGGMLYDLTFVGGAFGMYCGNQQFTTRNLQFRNVVTAVQIHWNWGWTWKSLDIQGSSVGISLLGGASTDRNTGSVIVLDSVIRDTDTAVLIPPVINDGGATAQAALVLDNIKLTNVPNAVRVNGSATLLAGGTKSIDSWGIGKSYANRAGTGTFLTGGDITPKRIIPQNLLGGLNGGYFERSRPQYESVPASGFTNVQDFGAKGDGNTDDTAAINAALLAHAGRSIIYFPAGTYIVTDTIFVPCESKIVGEAWSQIMASGAKFADMNNPKVMVKVGNPSDSGVIEITDMLFTVRGGAAGAVLLEWNVKESSPGSAAMWDSHFRIGGAAGSQLTSSDCPKLTGRVASKCIAGSMLMHMTSTSSGYLENVWAWVADHDLDILAQTQIDVYVARGILIESQGPTWLYGTASEHCVLYQYQLNNAKDLFMGMIQTESPYYQSTPKAPAPFSSAIGKFPNDPTFSDCPTSSVTCAVSWGLRIIKSSNIFMYGGGLYSWFSNYNQDCLKTESCQDKIIETISSTGLWFFNVITKAATEMISPQGGKAVLQSENHYGFASTVMAWLTQCGKV